MTITKEEFLSEINLIGGRGYGIFIETDSKKHIVETGDRILEVSPEVRDIHSVYTVKTAQTGLRQVYCLSYKGCCDGAIGRSILEE